MRVIKSRPPNFQQVAQAFPLVLTLKGVVYTWGDVIYNPDGFHIDPWLKAHEGVHFSRQGSDLERITQWWDKYCADPEFRFREELPAHRAEYRAFCAVHKRGGDRHAFLNHIANRLAGELYGAMLTPAEAARRITQ